MQIFIIGVKITELLSFAHLLGTALLSFNYSENSVSLGQQPVFSR